MNAKTVFLALASSSAISLITVFLVPGRPHHNALLEFRESHYNPGVERKLFVVTPTYYRKTQMPDLVRMKQTLMHLSGVVWLVVEDANSTNATVQQRLHSFNSHKNLLVYLSVHREGKKSIKGVHQRNEGLRWIYNNTSDEEDAVVYFADDDNTYDSEGLARVQRLTRKASIFNVGLIVGVTEGPVVRDGRIVGMSTPWRAGRTFPIDMAGFALNLRHMRTQANRYFTLDVKVGFQEDTFLRRSMRLQMSDFVPLTATEADTFVWHTKTTYKGAHRPRPLT